MDEDIRQEIQKIIWYIQEFENGEDKYLDEILDIIDGLEDFVKHTRLNYIRYSVLIKYSELATTLYCKNLLNEEAYKQLINYAKEDLTLYLNASNSLNDYLKIGKKCENYPDLEAAYILSIKLSFILNNINDYLHEIRLLEKDYTGIISYSGKDNIRDNGIKLNNEVNTLVKSLTLKEDENV